MSNSIFDQSTIPILEQAVGFAQARHEVLSSNIANLDTPGYRARDISPELFQSRLREAISERDQRRGPLSPGEQLQPTSDFAQVRESMRSILLHDDSDVSLEHQIAEISKNQMLHNTALTILTSQFRLLETAISERV